MKKITEALIKRRAKTENEDIPDKIEEKDPIEEARSDPQWYPNQPIPTKVQQINLGGPVLDPLFQFLNREQGSIPPKRAMDEGRRSFREVVAES